MDYRPDKLQNLMNWAMKLMALGWIVFGIIYIVHADFQDLTCYNCGPNDLPDIVELKLDKIDKTLTVFFAPNFEPKAGDWINVLKRKNHFLVKNNNLRGKIQVSLNGRHCRSIDPELDPRKLYGKLAFEYALSCK